MDKVRVLQVCSRLDKGGIQSVIMTLVKSLSSQFTFDIMVYDNTNHLYDCDIVFSGGRIIDLSQIEGIALPKSEKGKRFFWQLNENTIRSIMLENGPYQAVHCHFDIEAGYVLRAAAKAGIPVRICHTHRVFNQFGQHWLYRLLYHHWANLRERYITVRVGCSETVRASVWNNDSNSIVVYSPYDEKRYYYKEEDQKPFVAPRIVQVGSYSSNKNQLFSIEVLRYIHKRYPKSTLSFVGFENEEGYLAKLKDRVRSYNFEEFVQFHSSDEDIPSVLSKSSCLLFPSKSEGFGLVPIEAQAIGLRCFVSDNVITDVNCGGCYFLKLSDNPEFWADAVISDFEKNQGRKEYYNCSKYSGTIIASEFSKIYKGIMR